MIFCYFLLAQKVTKKGPPSSSRKHSGSSGQAAIPRLRTGQELQLPKAFGTDAAVLNLGTTPAILRDRCSIGTVSLLLGAGNISHCLEYDFLKVPNKLIQQLPAK